MRSVLRLCVDFWLIVALIGFLSVSAEEVTLLSNSTRIATALVKNKGLAMNIKTGPVDDYKSPKPFDLTIGGCTAKIKAFVNEGNKVQYDITVAGENGTAIDLSSVNADPEGIGFTSSDGYNRLLCKVDFEKIEGGNYTVELGLSGEVPPNLVLLSSSATIYEPIVSTSAPEPTSSPSSAALEICLIVGGVLLLIVVIAAAVFAVVCYLRRRKKRVAHIEEGTNTPKVTSKPDTPGKKQEVMPSPSNAAKNQSVEVAKTTRVSRISAHPVDDESLSSVDADQMVPPQLNPLSPTAQKSEALNPVLK